MYLKVRVKPGSRAESVVRESDDHYVICVKEKAERNLANTRVLDILKAMFPGQLVRIIHGHQGPSKLVAVDEREE